MCLLLVSFFFLFPILFFTDNFHRKLHQQNGTVKVHPYRERTASGPLRAHLLAHHAEEWVQECQKLNIELRGKEGGEASARVTGLPVGHQAEAQVAFTQDRFLDGLVKFIVATDQVFFILYYLFLYFF